VATHHASQKRDRGLRLDDESKWISILFENAAQTVPPIPQRRLPDRPQTIVGGMSPAPFLDYAGIYPNDRAVSSTIFSPKDLKKISWT
jgi:hypothetical protein